MYYDTTTIQNVTATVRCALQISKYPLSHVPLSAEPGRILVYSGTVSGESFQYYLLLLLRFALWHSYGGLDTYVQVTCCCVWENGSHVPFCERILNFQFDGKLVLCGSIWCRESRSTLTRGWYVVVIGPIE